MCLYLKATLGSLSPGSGEGDCLRSSPAKANSRGVRLPIIKEMQIKTQIRGHFIHTGKNSNLALAGEDEDEE